MLTATANRMINRNPYTQLANKTLKAAQQMQEDAEAIAVLLSIKASSPLTESQEKRLRTRYARMDARGQKLSDYIIGA